MINGINLDNVNKEIDSVLKDLNEILDRTGLMDVSHCKDGKPSISPASVANMSSALEKIAEGIK